jgi:hypothetical protein
VDTGKVKSRVPLDGKATALCVDAAGVNAFVAFAGKDTVLVVDLRAGRVSRGIDIVRPLGNHYADATSGRSVCDIVQIRWADQPQRLIGLGYNGNVLFVARY